MENSKGKILLIDDDTGFLAETEGVLREAGYEAATCPSSREALAAVKNYQPDCLILDIKMPHLDGQDLLLFMKRRYPALPVIISTGVSSIDERYLFKSGAAEILKKPFSADVLFAAIDSTISQDDEETPLVLHGFNFREIHEEVTRKIIVKALSESNFNVSLAARLLHISRQCLLRYIKRLQITY